MKRDKQQPDIDLPDLSARGRQTAFNLVKDPMGDIQGIVMAGTAGLTSEFEANVCAGAVIVTLCGVIAGVGKVENGPELLEYLTDQLSSTFLIEGAGLEG